MCNIELHNHLDTSNIRLLDCIISVEELIQTAADMGKKGVAITDHETVAAHVKAIQITRKLKKIDEKTGNSKIPQDFKLILGNEIYLVDSLEEVRDNYEGGGVTKFPHFLLLAKDKEAHEALRVLSSQAWKNSFYTGLMERVPTTKEHLAEVIKQYPNKLIGSSACLGSESSIHILNGDYDKAKSFLIWCSKLFGKDNFYLELQPSRSDEQRKVNEWLIKFSKELNLDLIVTSDTHYLRPEDADIHESYLNAKQGDREIASFYESCYLHTKDEIYSKLDYIDESIISQALLNTLKIGDMIEDYTIEAPTVLPRIELPEFEVKHTFKGGYEQYKYIEKMAYSTDEQDRYLIHLIEIGFVSNIPYKVLAKERFHEVIARIDIELQQLWELSIDLKQAMSSYYVTVSRIVELMWGDDDCNSSREEGSLVGSGRGSAVAFLINYLLGITQVNPMEYGIEIPYWRHLSSEMGSISSLDIDLDINGIKKSHIFDRIKESFGEDRFLQVCTYGTEGSKSALQTACRGLGYDVEIGQHLGSMIPFSRGENWSIHDCLYGDEEDGKEPIKQFINEIEKYPKLKETALKISGLINKRSIHSGGVLILNDSYVKSNALMKAPNGSFVSQFNLDDSQALGNIKYDILTIESLQKIQTTIDLLLDAGEITWQGSLRKTFNKYFHPEVIDKESPELFELASSGRVPDLFQFSTIVGHSAITKAKPTNLIEMMAANSLMRLQTDGREQPIDTFVRFKGDITLWYEEMEEFGLNEDEIKIMEEHLLPLNGVADTQESVMLLARDPRIASFNLKDATNLRKSIASKSDEVAKAIKETLFNSGERQGTRRKVLEYVWYQISRMLSYAFSSPHTLAYSLIAMIQLNIVSKYSPIYWSTAVLTVNSGSQEVDEGEKTKSTDYGKTASAIAAMKSRNIKVELPLINSANFSFTPDVENDRIIFSLKGIVGIGDEIVKEIIENRPYSSFEDFHERMYLAKKVQRAHMLKLIKAGAFNEFDTPVEIMKKFIVKEVNVKEVLNGANMPRIIALGLLDSAENKEYKEYFNFRKHLMSNVHETRTSPKDRIFIIKDDYSQMFFGNNFSYENTIVSKKKSRVEEVVVGHHNGKLLVSENAFDRQYEEKMAPVTSLFTDKEFVRKFNNAQFYELWKQDAQGTVAAWEMDSVSFYSSEHELDGIDFERYGVKDFNSLPETPVIISEYESRGQTRYNHELASIVGTVLDRNDKNNTITLLTAPSGVVVTIKTWSGRFGFYNRQIKANSKILEKSWFSRGNLLLVTGFRSDDLFILNAPKNQHTVNLITEVRSDNTIGIQSERAKAN